jgi:hypothetical protein
MPHTRHRLRRALLHPQAGDGPGDDQLPDLLGALEDAVGPLLVAVSAGQPSVPQNSRSKRHVRSGHVKRRRDSVMRPTPMEQSSRGLPQARLRRRTRCARHAPPASNTSEFFDVTARGSACSEERLKLSLSPGSGGARHYGTGHPADSAQSTRDAAAQEGDLRRGARRALRHPVAGWNPSANRNSSCFCAGTSTLRSASSGTSSPPLPPGLTELPPRGRTRPNIRPSCRA